MLVYVALPGPEVSKALLNLAIVTRSYSIYQIQTSTYFSSLTDASE